MWSTLMKFPSITTTALSRVWAQRFLPHRCGFREHESVGANKEKRGPFCLVDHYNTVRLHSAIGYVTPQDMLPGRQPEIERRS